MCVVVGGRREACPGTSTALEHISAPFITLTVHSATRFGAVYVQCVKKEPRAAASPAPDSYPASLKRAVKYGLSPPVSTAPSGHGLRNSHFTASDFPAAVERRRN
ncbi:unnamed protein product [Pleuronectes platessa]|uniref:Uncharacterized protein n=1 Tax=Pleuronectes platessa TaxID=8262 RepID=A0A9N7YHZ3_PLEPL|nr:unnamed protein product [Pleuronectes platessa]